MRLFLNIISAMLIVLLLVGCATYKKKARDFMMAGEWEKAREMWVMALQDSPSDKECLQGKQQAEYEITNKYVVDTKRRRDAGDHLGALESAIKIHDLHLLWGSSMDPDVAKYFNGELTKLYPSYLKMVDSAVKQNFPLKASYDFKRYRPLFESIGDKQEMDGMDLAITQTGQSYCGAIKSGSLSLPFWRQFVAKFCNYFQMDISQYDSKAAKIGSVLISKLSTSTMVAMLSGIDEQAIKQHSVSAFRNSAWYHPQGVGDLEVDVVGSYGQSMSRGKESRTYEYYVKNPNTKKSELRYYNYKIDTVSQSMSLKLVAKYKLNGQKFSFQHKDSLEEESWSFPGYQAPNIDIDEQEEELTDKDSWLALQFKEYENKLSLSFKQAWVQEYCQTNSTDPSRNGMGEFVLKCMRGEDEMYSDLIDSWHLSHFGLPSKQAVELIGPYY